MMLREIIRCFFVVALLVSVTSAERCFVCGVGYEVGRPSVMLNGCPGLSGTPCTCNDLEIAGLQGLISIDQCSIVRSLIFETCYCEENTTQNTWFPTYNPRVPSSSLRSATHARVLTRPQAQDDANFAYLLLIIPFFCIMGCLIDYFSGAPVCCGCFFNVDGRRPNLPSIPVSTPISSTENARSRRPLVLATLFPKEGNKPEGSGPPGGRGSLKYNSQSKRYVFCEDAPDATACSICLEVLVPEDDAVTGSCSHVYHRTCIMNWLHGEHDDCPNCRQPMWDPETYKILDECIKAQKSNSQFGV